MQHKGFSLIELVIGIGIAAGIMFMVGIIGSQFSGVANFVNLKLQNRQDTERVFETMTTEIRSMSPSGLGAYALESANATSVVFYSDIDRDGVMERVRYFVGTSTIEKGTIKPSGNPLVYATSTEIVKTIVPNLVSTSSVFQYFNSVATDTQNPMAQPIDVSQVRIVKISASVDVNPGQTPLPTTFTTTVNMRNLRTN